MVRKTWDHSARETSRAHNAGTGIRSVTNKLVLCPQNHPRITTGIHRGAGRDPARDKVIADYPIIHYTGVGMVFKKALW